MKVVFICTGNTCRSPMAEGILKDLAEKDKLNIDVKSVGIHASFGTNAASFAIEAMKDIGIDIRDHKSDQVNSELLDKADLVLTMSNSHKKAILLQYPLMKGRVFLLNEYAFGINKDIEDPFGGSLRYYEKARDEIFRAVEEIVGKIVNNEQWTVNNKRIVNNEQWTVNKKKGIME